MKTEWLRQLNGFGGMAEEALQALVGVMQVRAYNAQTLIVQQGAVADKVFVVLEGEVGVERHLPDGHTVGMCTLSSGACFGTLGVLDGGDCAADCRAVGKVRLAEMARDDFLALMDGDAPSALQFQLVVVGALFQNLRDTNHRLAELVCLPKGDIELIELEDSLIGLN